jgi:hypothetical protein
LETNFPSDNYFFCPVSKIKFAFWKKCLIQLLWGCTAFLKSIPNLRPWKICVKKINLACKAAYEGAS